MINCLKPIAYNPNPWSRTRLTIPDPTEQNSCHIFFLTIKKNHAILKPIVGISQVLTPTDMITISYQAAPADFRIK
jgi:hypothetical protein